MAVIEADEIQAERDLSDELAQYPGEWVAVSRHRIVAHAPTLEELSNLVEATEVEGVFKVPEGESGACFF